MSTALYFDPRAPAFTSMITIGQALGRLGIEDFEINECSQHGVGMMPCGLEFANDADAAAFKLASPIRILTQEEFDRHRQAREEARGAAYQIGLTLAAQNGRPYAFPNAPAAAETPKSWLRKLLDWGRGR